MHKERGHSLKGLQFFPAHNFFSKPKIQETHCDLVPHAFQQIQFFDRVGTPPTRSARIATPMQRSPVHSGAQIRFPPVRNWLKAICRKLSAVIALSLFPDQKVWKARESSSNPLPSSPGWGSQRWPRVLTSKWTLQTQSRSWSSNSQIVTDNTLKVSEINFAAAVHRPG